MKLTVLAPLSPEIFSTVPPVHVSPSRSSASVCASRLALFYRLPALKPTQACAVGLMSVVLQVISTAADALEAIVVAATAAALKANLFIVPPGKHR